MSTVFEASYDELKSMESQRDNALKALEAKDTEIEHLREALLRCAAPYSGKPGSSRDLTKYATGLAQEFQRRRELAARVIGMKIESSDEQSLPGSKP